MICHACVTIIISGITYTVGDSGRIWPPTMKYNILLLLAVDSKMDPKSTMGWMDGYQSH